MNKKEALDYLRANHPQLAKHIGNADGGTIVKLQSALEATAKSGHDARFLAGSLSRGLESKAITSESLPQDAETLRGVFEAVRRAGHDPVHLESAISAGMRSKAITHESLPQSAENLRAIFDEARKVSLYTSLLTDALESGFESRTLTPTSLPYYAKLLKTLPRGLKPEEVIQHAVEAHKLGVPADKIPLYQKKIMGRGHFPNAGLVHELHKAKMKEAGAKRRER